MDALEAELMVAGKVAEAKKVQKMMGTAKVSQMKKADAESQTVRFQVSPARREAPVYS